MTLDMRRGALLSEGRHLKAPDLGLHVQTSRLVSLSDRAIGLQLIRLEIEDGELDITLEASFEGTELGLVIDRLGQDLGLWHTQHSGKRLAMATVAALQVDGRDIPPTALGPIEIVVDLEIPPRASCLLPAVRCHRAQRHQGSGSRQGSPGQAEPSEQTWAGAAWSRRTRRPG